MASRGDIMRDRWGKTTGELYIIRPFEKADITLLDFTPESSDRAIGVAPVTWSRRAMYLK